MSYLIRNNPLSFSFSVIFSLMSASLVYGQDHDLEEVIIIGHPLSGEGLSQAATQLTGAELSRALGSSIGDTVGRLPGINNSSFGAAVGRPIIHGLSGPRVKVMEDRIDTLDVSVSSGDHGVAVESFLANEIEILKGPATLLYGSGAIGGVVDVHTGRIPHERDEHIHGKAEIRTATNADLWQGAFRLDGSSTALAWHVDGFARDAGEYDIPSYAESAQLRATEAELEPGSVGEHKKEATLAGSQLSSNGYAFGLSYLGDRAFYGFAVSQLNNKYGLPGSHSHEGDEVSSLDTSPVLDMEQTRLDVEIGIEDPFNGIESFNLRLGLNNYQHQEIEPAGDVATLFENDAYELRAELVHQDFYAWKGAFGVQLTEREFSAVGEESFVPPIESSNIGAFWVVERSFNEIDSVDSDSKRQKFSVEAGLRVESVDYRPSQINADDKQFTAYAASLGLVVPFTDQFSLSLHSAYSARAPIGEELYSNGAHLATSSYELGDESLKEEAALDLSATLRFVSSNSELHATVYHIRFADFIYQQTTGAIQEALPVQLYSQDDATFSGLDLALKFTLLEMTDGYLDVTAMYDVVNAQLDVIGNDKLPRLPPSRWGVGLEAQFSVANFSVDYMRITSKNRMSALELPTDSYQDLRAYAGLLIPGKGNAELEIFLQGRNLLNEDQRNHGSFIKDVAPQPGISVELGARYSF